MWAKESQALPTNLLLSFLFVQALSALSFYNLNDVHFLVCYEDFSLSYIEKINIEISAK